MLGKTDRRDFRYYRDVAGKEMAVPFRHELVSGLLALQHGKADLVAYLAAVHHGKVRLSIRSLPREPRPSEPNRRFARGVWDGDLVPAAGLGGGVKVPVTAVDLSYMELGEANARGPSWLARMLALRDDPALGPFRLGFLEMIMKAADERASGGAS
jgi:CRISPR-associated endonuclease/helicase Cas3